MALLEGIHIRNYRALHDVSLGKLPDQRKAEKLPKLIAIIGPNGSGKSSIMDALGFIGDCLQLGVEEACDRPHRGGFERLRTRGCHEPIGFELYYRESPKGRPISYTLEIDCNEAGRPHVVFEQLRQARSGKVHGRLFPFVELRNGAGYAWAGEATETGEGERREEVRLTDSQQLGITVLGQIAEHPRITAFRDFLRGWYLSYFVPELARGLPTAGAHKHLNRTGENLANYVQFLERNHPDRFGEVLKRIERKIPGIRNIRHERQKDGRLLLQFNERGYEDPFYAADMSDGTLKMFAYLLLMEDPEPAPLVGIEEPENGLHHQLLETLASELRRYARREAGPQVFVTTHAPYFVDALKPEEVWVVAKGKDGFSTVARAADLSGVRAMHAEGLPLGSLWHSNHFGRGNP